MAVNIAFPLRPGTAGAFATNESTIEAVKDDLVILLLSNHGERPIHGDYGANLRKVLFEPGPNVLQRAEDLVLAAIEKWMPFLKVDELIISDSSTDSTVGSNELRIRINFSAGQLEGSLDQRIRN